MLVTEYFLIPYPYQVYSRETELAQILGLVSKLRYGIGYIVI